MTVEIDRATLGARLREMREYRGFSQEEVSQYLSIPRPAISLMESGSRGLDVLELRKLAALYQCTVDELTGDTSSGVDQKSIGLVARAAAALSPEDREEVLRFAEFLQSRRAVKQGSQ
jgi:transcriptional regulator with XRE-family HTH domain